MKYIYNFSAFILFFCILFKVRKEKYLIVTSLVFWCVFFYFSYIAFSCIFIDEINKNWNFSQNTLFYTRIIIFIYNIIFSFFILNCTNTDKKIESSLSIKERKKIAYQVSYLIVIIGFLVLLLAIMQLMSTWKSEKGALAYFAIRKAGGVLEKKYHLRLFLYLLISSSFYLYLKKQKYYFFIPLLLIVLFETLSEQRTTAFVVLLYLYVFYVTINKDLKLQIIVPLLLVLLVGVLFSRAEALMVDLSLNMIFGEFFETFTTIPYLIDNKLYGYGFNFERIICDYTFVSFIPGSIRANLVSYDGCGAELAKIIGKGYGLGSNFIFEQLFEFGYLGFITSIIIPMFLIVIDRKLKGWTNLIIKIYFIFQLRLYIREGITQFYIIFYILLMYCVFFYFCSTSKTIFIKRKGRKKHRIFIKNILKYMKY